MSIAEDIAILKQNLQLEESIDFAAEDTEEAFLQAKSFAMQVRRRKNLPWTEETSLALENLQRKIFERSASLHGFVECSPAIKALTMDLDATFSKNFELLDNERLKRISNSTENLSGQYQRAKGTFQVLKNTIILKEAFDAGAYTIDHLDQVAGSIKNGVYFSSNWNERIRWDVERLRTRLEYEKYKLAHATKKQGEIRDDSISSAQKLLTTAIISCVPKHYVLHCSTAATRTISLPVEIGDTVQLAYSIEFVDKTIPVSDRAEDISDLYAAALLMKRFQSAILQDNIDELKAVASSVVPQSSDTDVSQSVDEVIQLAGHLARYNICAKGIFIALSYGAMSGNVGSINLSTVRIDELQQSVNEITQVEGHTLREAKYWFQKLGITGHSYLGKLFEAARLVLSIRTCQLEGRWLAKNVLSGTSVEVLLKDSPSTEISSIDLVKDELKLARDELDNRRSIDAIIRNLRSGSGLLRARGESSVLQIDELQEAFLAGRQVTNKSMKLVQVMEKASFILQLRKAVQRREFDVLDDILCNVPDTPEVSREVEAARDLLADLAHTEKRLRDALQINGYTAFDIESVDAAIRFASKQVHKSETTDRLLRSVMILRELKSAQKEAGAGSRSKISDLIARAEASDVAEELEERLKTYAREVEGEKVKRQLNRALACSISGKPGNLDFTSVNIPDLDDTIAAAAGFHNSGAGIDDLFRTGSLARELRHACLSERWDLEHMCDMNILKTLVGPVNGVGTTSVLKDPSSLRLSPAIRFSKDPESVPYILRKAGDWIVPQGRKEIQLLSNHVSDKVIRVVITEAIKQTDLKCLRDAISVADILCNQSMTSAKRLKVTGTILFSIRQSKLSKNLFGLAAALETACRAEEEGLVHDDARREILLAMNLLRSQTGQRDLGIKKSNAKK